MYGASPPPQPLLHRPQLIISILRSTQVPRQRVSPGGQTQNPSMQAAPVGHVTPQEPQLRMSFPRSTQALPQRVRPGPHACPLGMVVRADGVGLGVGAALVRDPPAVAVACQSPRSPGNGPVSIPSTAPVQRLTG